jgi:transcriptional regulator with XRE-family HTH domain
MSTMRERASVSAMTEGVGHRIRERRTRIGMPVNALAERAGVDRGRLAAIEAGTAKNVRPATIGAIERALDELEVEHGIADPGLPPGARRIGDPADDLIEFTIEGTDGIKAVVKGPIRNMDELQAAAQKLIEGMQVRPPAENGA